MPSASFVSTLTINPTTRHLTAIIDSTTETTKAKPCVISHRTPQSAATKLSQVSTHPTSNLERRKTALG